MTDCVLQRRLGRCEVGHEHGDVRHDETDGEERPCDERPGRDDLLAAAAGALGQWNPTDAWCMHWGQMGRSQRWQITPARRSGCR